MTSMACTKCGEQFFQPPGHRGHPIERCTACRPARTQKPVTKSCPVCGTVFTAGRTRVYCSSQCRNTRAQAEREQRREAARGITEKLCTRCKTIHPVSEFRRDKNRLDGLYPICRDCWRIYVGAKAQTPSAWASKAEYDANYRRENKDRLRDDWYSSYLWTTYRMTEQQYDDLLTLQGGACAICKTTDAGRSRGRDNGRFHVDHDHTCCQGRRSCGSCIRGLLCNRCNWGIGNFQDNLTTIANAMTYLAAWAEATKP